jgi:hypothetical protein
VPATLGLTSSPAPRSPSPAPHSGSSASLPLARLRRRVTIVDDAWVERPLGAFLGCWRVEAAGVEGAGRDATGDWAVFRGSVATSTASEHPKQPRASAHDVSVPLPPPRICSKNHYMPHYTAPRVVSVRLPGEVFEAWKQRARDDGRSVSGSITHLVKEEVENRLAPRKTNRKLTGFLSHLDVPCSLDEWRAARREVSRKLAPRAPRKRRSRGIR